MIIRIQNSEFRVKNLIIFCFFSFITLHSSLLTHSASAQCPIGTRASGLVSSGGSISDFGNQQGICVADDKAKFVSFKIPTYDDLVSIYYTQASSISTAYTKEPYIESGATNINLTFTNNKLYRIKGDLDINANMAGDKIGLVFIDGDLNFKADYTRGRGLPSQNEMGTVFIVKGNVNISSTIKNVDAIIISSGIICTAFDFLVTNSCPTFYKPSEQLTVNGSLISLNPANKIQFKRTLIDNSVAAEVVNHQPKYLVILRNIFSSPLQKWSEIQ